MRLDHLPAGPAFVRARLEVEGVRVDLEAPVELVRGSTTTAALA